MNIFEADSDAHARTVARTHTRDRRSEREREINRERQAVYRERKSTEQQKKHINFWTFRNLVDFSL